MAIRSCGHLVSQTGRNCISAFAVRLSAEKLPATPHSVNPWLFIVDPWQGQGQGQGEGQGQGQGLGSNRRRKRKVVHMRAVHSVSSNPRRRQSKKELERTEAEGEAQGSSSKKAIRLLRIQKVADMRDRGLNPFAYTFERTHKVAEVKQLYRNLEAGEVRDTPEDQVAVAGRVVARRVFGKLAFLTLRDDSSTIQLYCEKVHMDTHAGAVSAGETAEEATLDDADAAPESSQPPSVWGFDGMVKNSIDVGDIVGARGGVKRTEKGELSVYVSELMILTKALLPLPDKWHGLVDVEMRYRQRYLDMIVNPQVVDVFRSRAKIISVIRQHMEVKDFVEVETPVLQAAAGGADARPFVTHHNALKQDMVLRIATELHLKRMLVGGFDRVFEIGRIFRNEGISTRHNPEFTSVEMYQAYADYEAMMQLVEELVTVSAQAVIGTLDITYQGTPICLQRPWRRGSMQSLVQEVCGVDFLAFGTDVAAAREEALPVLSPALGGQGRAEAALAACPSVGHVLNEVFEAVVEKTLIQPTFVTEHPVEISPLAKPHRSKKGVVERFELFIYGRELANAFSELTDPLDQRMRFESQVSAHREKMAAARERAKAQGGGAEAVAADEEYDVTLDEDFLNALEYGMPPSAGMGIGIDRLVMLLTNSSSIRDVIAFPVLKSPTAPTAALAP